MYVGLDEVHDCIYVYIHTQAPLPDVYRGKYRDPETAGQLYAEEVKKLIDQAHSQGKKVCSVCAIQLCNWNVSCSQKSSMQFWLAYVGYLVLLLCHVPWLQIAAFICESAVGPGGEIILPKGYLRAVYK